MSSKTWHRQSISNHRWHVLLTPLLLGITACVLLISGMAVAILLGGQYGRPGLYVVGAATLSIALVIMLMLRQDELIAVLLILLHLYVDWYLGLYFVSVTITLLLLIIFFIARSPRHPWIIPDVLWLWVLFLALTVVPALRGATNLFDAALYYPNVICGALAIFWLGAVIARDSTTLLRFFKLLALLGVLLALHTILQETTGIVLFGTGRADAFLSEKSFYELAGSGVHRVGSFFIDPDWNGTFMATLLFIPLGLFIQSSSLLEKCFFLAETSLIALALLFTFSGGALVGVAVGAIVLTIFVGRAGYRVLIPLYVTAAGVAFVLFFPKEFALLFQHATGVSELSLRIGAWQTALRVISAYPLTGVGLGLNAYGTSAERYRVPAEFIDLGHPHNSYLELGAMAGLPVLILFVALLAFGLWQALRNWRKADIGPRSLIGAGLAAVTVLSVNSVSINGWTLPPLAALGWLILGVISSPLLHKNLVGSNDAY